MGDTPTSRGVRGGLLALLLAHVVWGAVRLPDKAIARRADEIARFRERGPVAHLSGDAAAARVDAIAWLLAHTPARAAIRYDGKAQGALELAAGALAPRLLVAAAATAPPAGLAFARARLGDREGEVWLLALADGGLRVEVR